MKLEKQMVPVGVGVTVLGIGLSLGHNCGYAVNPARDLAPRVFTFLAGWGPGKKNFHGKNNLFNRTIFLISTL